MKYSLSDLIDIEQLQVLQDRLNEIYPFPSSIIDNDGKILTATAWQDICTKFHRISKDCENECKISDRYILEHLHEANPAISYECPHGLIDSAAPIIIEGQHLGNFFTGQFFLKKPDLDFFRNQAKKFGFDEKKYLEAVSKVPIWNKKQLNSYLLFIKSLIDVISCFGLKKLKEIETNKIIKERENYYHFMFESLPVGVGFGEAGGKILDANQYLLDMIGYGLNEYQQLDNDALYHIPGERQKIIADLKKQKKIRNREILLRRKNNSIFYAMLNIDLVEKDGKQYLLTTIRDISEQKRAIETLKNQMHHLEIFKGISKNSKTLVI